MTKGHVKKIADIFYKTKPLVGPCRAERLEWNELRERLKRDVIPDAYHSFFDEYCTAFRNA